MCNLVSWPKYKQSVFSEPITVVFGWDDVNNDGWVDGTDDIKESNLVITKDGDAVTNKCFEDPGCNEVANTFTFQITSFSHLYLAGTIDEDGIRFHHIQKFRGDKVFCRIHKRKMKCGGRSSGR